MKNEVSRLRNCNVFPKGHGSELICKKTKNSIVIKGKLGKGHNAEKRALQYYPSTDRMVVTFSFKLSKYLPFKGNNS